MKSLRSVFQNWLTLGVIFFFSVLVFLFITGRISAQVSNLITNGDFENGSTGWSGISASNITTADFHSGTKALNIATSSTEAIRGNIAVTPGQNYTITAWTKWTAFNQGGGSNWGNDIIRVGETGDQDIGSIIVHNNVAQNEWTKVAIPFTPTKTSVTIDLGIWGPVTNANIYFDDVMVFQNSGTNASPTVSINSGASSYTTIPASVPFTSTVDDIDGAVSYYFWDFGDGGRSNGTNPTHTYIANGVYTVKLTVADDKNATAVATKQVTVQDSSYPSISITNASPLTITSPTVTISGSATGGSGAAISNVTWSNQRDGKTGIATGTSNWSFSLDLTNSSGKNRISINALDANGKLAHIDLIVNYNPTGTVTIAGGASGVTQNSNSIERYDKFEATFSLQNGRFSNPYFPYDTSLPAGMPNGQGITVNGIFTSPSGQTYTQPGFFYQPFTRNTSNQTLVASGSPAWKIRFAPTELGTWTYKINLADASGNATITDNSKLTFNVVTPTNTSNHGFIKVSTTDKRYFEFSDGTPFNGVGPTAGGGDSFTVDQQITKVGTGGANFGRIWMSGSNISGSSWVPYMGGLGYDGNVPNSGLTSEEAYGDGMFSLKLASSGPPCSFYGWQGGAPTIASVIPNRNYRILVRLKTIGVTGTGGFTFRPNTAWPDTCSKFAGQTLVIPYQTGTTDWHVVTGTWNSGSTSKLGISLMTLENVTSGQVYIDEVSIREDLGSGQLGPEVLPRSKFNLHEYFSQEPSWNWDYALDKYAQNGMYQKIVAMEKQDYLFNHIAPAGYAYERGNQIQNTGGPLLYQQYFWRYMTARWGYSRAVQAWEYANEQAPGDFTMSERLGQYMHSIDPIKHLNSPSFWCCVQQGGAYFWQSSPANQDYADAHAYVANTTGTTQDTTSWLGTTDPITGGSMVTDSALYVTGHSLNIISTNAGGNKPFIMGESGIIYNGVVVGQNDTDTTGVWLHQYLWPQMNTGAVYFPGYWWNNTINSNNLYNLFKPYRSFMEGSAGDTINKRVPLNNGKYQDAQLTLPTGVRGWGQKDITNGGAHFWMYDTGYTWVTPNGGSALGGKAVSFAGLPAKSYVVEFWNTWTGTVTTQNIDHSGGTLNLTIPGAFTNKDIAVKIIPSTGYPQSPQSPTSTPQPPTPTPVPGDVSGDGRITLADLTTLLGNFGKTGQTRLQGDLDGNGTVNLTDLSQLLANFGK